MELNDDILKEIERIAAASYSPREVAFILGLKVSEFVDLVRDEDSDAAVAYFKGFYSSELKVRESIMLTARNGSSPAHTMSNILFNETRRKLKKDGYLDDLEE
jgi:hypothetical protein